MRLDHLPTTTTADGREVCLRLGVDLGGSDIKFGATNLDADQILLGALVKLPSLTQEGPQKTVSQILAGIEQVLAQLGAHWSQVADVAVTVPCPCSAEGLILEVANLGSAENRQLWKVPLGELLAVALAERAGLAIPTFACNDANAAGQDDDFIRYGHSTAPRTSVFITTGTGLGGCVISAGSVFYGNGQAGELGHVKVAVPAAEANRFSAEPFPKCGCGGDQCVETRASLTGLVRRIGWALSDAGLALIGAELAARGQTVDPATIAQLQALYLQGAKQAAYQVRTFADAGEDAFCRWLLEDWAIMIGALFASLAPVLHPGLFVIGGGLTEMSEGARGWFLEAVQASYDAINTQGCFAREPGNCEIAWSQSTDQGWRGAILMGMRAAR